jgi:hypothetical protein
MNYKEHITKFDYVDARDSRLVKFQYEMEGETRRLNSSWFRGSDANFLPIKSDLLSNVDEYIFKGLVPDDPIVTKDSNVVTFGSCFAKEINIQLAERGFTCIQKPNVAACTPTNKREILKVPEAIIGGVNSTFTVRQLLEWAWLNVEPKDETWHGHDKAVIERNERYRKETAERFSQADLFIVVLGLSEVWRNKETGDVFWKAIPYTQYDENKHEFCNTTVEENKENIQAILQLVKENAPNAKVVFILDPVALEATFRPMNCIAADAVSKAVLRVAIDEVLREHTDAFYFPCYEMVRAYNAYQDDNRHPTLDIIIEMMGYFYKFYVKDA